MALKKTVSFQLEYAPQYTLTKYISRRTRLQVVRVYHKTSPIVQGYFAFATECDNDSGVPHTLEHLVFMGSKKYPYKGLLDTAGNLCMSSTNAWTGVDQTVYTLTSAGWKGFSKMFQAYLDHLLYPIITDSSCFSEVYHVDPEDCTEKGVVFSEMEAIESQSWFKSILAKQRLLFPEGSGYRSETGGLTENLKTLTKDEIVDFHERMYSPENMCLIVTGNVPEDELLAIIDEWDSQLPEFRAENYKRPFVDSPLSQIPVNRDHTLESTIEFPELDESQGEILFSWIGSDYKNHLEDQAISILMEYFTETAIAPFMKELVEISAPFANAVEYWTDDYMRTIVNLHVHGVPSAKMDITKTKVLEVLRSHKLDLKRLRQVLDNHKWEYILSCEKNGDNVLSQMVITDFLYGDEEGSTLKESLESLQDFDMLLKWSVDDWSNLMKKIFIVNRPVIILGEPSAAMYDNFEAEKEKQLEKRAKSLTVVERASLSALEKAVKQQNESVIPKDILAEFEIEDPAHSVDFIETESIDYFVNSGINSISRELLNSRPSDYPLHIHLENFQSQFVEIHFLMNSRHIKDIQLLPFYHVFDEIFSMPMAQEGSGRILSYEEVVSKLKSETVDSQVTMGLNGSYSDFIDIRLRCRTEKYEDTVKWIRYCLFDMIFDEKRVTILLQNYLDSIVETKREGDIMLQSLTCRKLYTNKSLNVATDPIYVEPIIEQILEDIDNGLYESKILPKLEYMRSLLRSSINNFHVLIFGDISKIKNNIYKPWDSLIEKYDVKQIPALKKIPPAPKAIDTISPLCSNPGKKAFIITTPASESSYMNTVIKLPIDDDYRNIEYSKIVLASEYLQCVEGPFWKGIRGAGLAYGANMVRMSEINSWSFNVYRGADIVNCYKTAQEIVNNYATGKETFDSQLIQGAISSIINRIATLESGYYHAAASKYVDNYLLKRGPDYNRFFLNQLNQISIEDLKDVMVRYLAHLFDSNKSSVFISCHPSKLESLKEFFEMEGFEVEVEELDDQVDSETSSETDINQS